MLWMNADMKKCFSLSAPNQLSIAKGKTSNSNAPLQARLDAILRFLAFSDAAASGIGIIHPRRLPPLGKILVEESYQCLLFRLVGERVGGTRARALPFDG